MQLLLPHCSGRGTQGWGWGYSPLFLSWTKYKIDTPYFLLKIATSQQPNVRYQLIASFFQQFTNLNTNLSFFIICLFLFFVSVILQHVNWKNCNYLYIRKNTWKSMIIFKKRMYIYTCIIFWNLNTVSANAFFINYNRENFVIYKKH